MNIFIGSDHRGWLLKNLAITAPISFPEDWKFVDCGPVERVESYDYPESAHEVAKRVSEIEDSFGVLICGSGIGVAITANKTPGIRAATCRTVEDAFGTRSHNNANVVCIGADVTDMNSAFNIIRTFINTPFEGGRHQRRVDMIE